LIDPEDDGCSDSDCGHEGMGAPIITCVDAPPVFEPAKHYLDFVTLAVDHENNSANDPTVINLRHTMRERKIRFNLAHLRIGQTNQVTHGNASFASPLSQPRDIYASTLISPEPSGA
jgi:hypothetical protein